ncbi:hypothetical protein [Kutzneria sp. NPDC052558]|uniref:hypothetical protein n=1 Tax=Kutzneria sp. NPDC052558 TaxID=3364121 RepID=UPI0037C7646C
MTASTKATSISGSVNPARLASIAPNTSAAIASAPVICPVQWSGTRRRADGEVRASRSIITAAPGRCRSRATV